MGIARKNRKADVYRNNNQNDGQGGWTDDYALNGTILVGYSRESSNETEVADRDRGLIDYTVYASRYADVQKGDFIVLDDLTLKVKSVEKPSRGDLEIKTVHKQPDTEEIV